MEKTNNLSKIKSYIKSPYFGHLIGIAGIAIGVFFWFVSRVHPELSYSIASIRTNIVRKEAADKLRVFYDDREVTEELNAVQIAIWNNGKAPIRMSDTLSTIKLITRPPTPILEFAIKEISRREIRFSFSDSLFHLGIVPITWRILEQDDGIIAQVMYEGDEKVDFLIVGSIVNQHSPRQAIQKRSEGKVKTFIILLIFLFAGWGLWYAINDLKYYWSIIILRLVIIAFLLIYIYQWIAFYALSPTIPFIF